MAQNFQQQAKGTTMTYKIRVKNHLDPCWCEWFEGWTIMNLEDGEVLLTGVNVDQSALHGTLNKIRDLNLKLISVVEVNLAQAENENSDSDLSQITKNTETS
jgi:hypothetical protein